jgi:hypothetical protein
MATYYVANYGNNANNGTSTATPWATVQFALGAASGTNPGLVAGDTVWIAPGTYREVVTTTTLTGTSGNTIKIYGDPTFTRQWILGSPGRVRLTNFTTDTALPTQSQTLAVSGDYIEIQDLCIDGHPFGSVSPTVSTGSALYLTGGNLSVTNCSVQTTNAGRQVAITWYCTTGKNNFTVDQCSVFAPFGIFVFSVAQTATFNVNAVIKDTFVMAGNDFAIVFEGASANQVTGAVVYNSTIVGASQGITLANIGQVGGSSTVLRNNLIYAPKGIGITSTASVTITQTNNSVFATTNFNNVLPNTNNISAPMFDLGSSRVQAFSTFPWFAPATGSPLIGAGTATGAPTVDLYGNTWTGNPTIGAIESKTESDAGFYFPMERNASTITIAPGSTSQSIELYLGATGLTASTTGLTARYNRTRTASVSIPLVARTIAQAWTSGGFAEVDATNMPGVYRLDLPDAALAAGADDVTVVVRGASGTNGAVMTVKLSSGGLSSTETAQAVWNASASSYNTAGSMGEAGQKLTGYSLASSQTFSTTGSVGSVTGSVTVGTNNDKTGYTLSTAGNTASADAVWNATRSTHTTAGTFGEYVNAELVTPVSQASLVRMGPFQVIADGVTTPMPIDIQKGAQHGVDIQCVDNNLNGVDITAATVTAKVYDSGGALVDTYSCTATYAADGRATFTIDTTVTNTPGTYTATITRTTGASDTQVFGPLRIYVRDI